MSISRRVFGGLFVIFFILQFSTIALGTDLNAKDVNTIKKFEGEFVSVTGLIYSTHTARSGKVRFLNFGPDYRTAFTVVIFTGDLNNFLSKVGDPTTYYNNMRVRVEGRVKMYRGKPEIIANSPDQITVIK